MKLRTLFIGGAAAAAARYLFDPEQGAARRTRLKNQAMARIGDLGGSATGAARGAVEQMKERATELKDSATSSTSTAGDGGFRA